VPTLSHRYKLDVRLKLARAADFDEVFKHGQRSADQLFTILYRSSGLDHPRLGMTASAKRVRTAVGRNRIRRLIRESFRHAACRLAGLDIVVMVKEPANQVPNAEVVKSLDGHWARLEQAAIRA
jgi:ribonuclease P protein component